MKLNRTLTFCLAIALSAALAIGGTMAYLTDTATAQNVFVLGEGVDITLDEAPVIKDGDSYVVDPDPEATRQPGNEYKDIYPGAVMPKDPTITMAEESSDAYVRVKVTVEGGKNWLHLYGGADLTANFMALINNELGEGWEIVTVEEVENNVVATILYAQRLTAGAETSAVFRHVVFSANVTQENLALFGEQFHIDVMAEAMQAMGFEDAATAFAAFDAATVTVDEPAGGDVSAGEDVPADDSAVQEPDTDDVTGEVTEGE